MSLEIKGFIETSLLDWDGKIVSVIFLPGCDFRCPFCSNSGLILNPQAYKTIPHEDIFNYLEAHRDFADGVCITGGEPALHKDNGLTEFIRHIKDMGFLVKLDTNGNSPDYLKYLVDNKLVDYVAIDIKTAPDKYQKATNVLTNIENIRKSVRLLIDSGIDHEFRTTAVPTIVTVEDIEKICEFIKGAKKYAIQQFEPDYCEDIELRKLKPYPKEIVDRMVEIARRHLTNVIARGKWPL
jgi:pyruvate formate lyase activating enzyme